MVDDSISLCTQQAMVEASLPVAGGKVLLIDGAGSRGTATANSATYGATKAAMPQLLRSLAAELKGSPVSVHLASPGMVATDLLLKGKVLMLEMCITAETALAV